MSRRAPAEQLLHEQGAPETVQRSPHQRPHPGDSRRRWSDRGRASSARTVDGLIALPLSRLTLSSAPSRRSCRSKPARAARPRSNELFVTHIFRARQFRRGAHSTGDASLGMILRAKKRAVIPARAGPKQKGGTLSVLEERARLPRQEPGSAPLPLGAPSRSRALIDNEVPNRTFPSGRLGGSGRTCGMELSGLGLRRSS